MRRYRLRVHRRHRVHRRAGARRRVYRKKHVRHRRRAYRHRRKVGGKRRYKKRRGCYRRRRRGRGLFDTIKGAFNTANDWLKKTKIISTIGKHLTPFAGSYAPLVQGATSFADKAGYGRRKYRRRRYGSGNPYPYNLAGGSRILF